MPEDQQRLAEDPAAGDGGGGELRIPEPYRSGGRLTLFSFTTESLSPVYRAVMEIFYAAKERYQIQLRPEAVEGELRRLGFAGPLAVERALDQLVEWGNLARSHDTERVRTLADFRRRHFVYRLTPAGEASMRAVEAVLEALASSGSLQRVMLGAILRTLGELGDELAAPEPRGDHLYERLVTADGHFRTLTENASTFMARLHEAIETSEVRTEAFLLYKQRVIEYLEEFVSELAEQAPRIAEQVRRVEAAGVEPLVELAAGAARAPSLEEGDGDGDDGAEDVGAATLRRRWRGIAAWFVPHAGEPPTSDRLRRAALAAVRRILLVLERLHEKRFRRVNRTADLLHLAAAFDAMEPTEADEAHRLFQTAFALYGARHLGGLEEDLDPEYDPEVETATPRVAPEVSWWQAAPVPVPPALRDLGRRAPPGRTGGVVDHSKVKRLLAERDRRRRLAKRRALARFLDRGPLPLAGLPPLEDDELRLLLSFLDRLLSTAPRNGVRRARSGDGRLELWLSEPAAGELATLVTPSGRLTLPAWELEVAEVTPTATADGAVAMAAGGRR